MDPFASFAHLTDPRVQGRCLHQLVDILALLLCGTLAGCDDLPEICDYGRARLAFLRTELGLAFANGIPSEDTLERLLLYPTIFQVLGIQIFATLKGPLRRV